MMDYEVMKTEGGFQMKVNGKWYVVPHKYRHYNKHKLMKMYEEGEFKAVTEPVAA
jgi:hypothetical protein